MPGSSLLIDSKKKNYKTITNYIQIDFFER